MSFLPKKLLLLALLNVILNTHTSIHSYTDENIQQLYWYAQRAKVHDCIPVTEPIKSTVVEVAKKYGFEQKLLFFESKTALTSYVTKDILHVTKDLVFTAKRLIIATHHANGEPKHLDQIKIEIEDEIKRLADRNQKGISDRFSSNLLVDLPLAIPAIFFALKKDLKPGYYIGLIGLGCIINGITRGLLNYMQSIEEDAADASMYKKLLDCHDYNAAFSEINEDLMCHHSNPQNSFVTRFTACKPTYLDRALNGLKLMKKHGCDIKKIIAQSSPASQELFKTLMQKYCSLDYEQKYL